MIKAFHQNNIKVYADVVLNHMYANENQLEANPAVKHYVFNEAKKSDIQYQPYPTNEIIWKIPSAKPGNYVIQIKGYMLNWKYDYTKRGYDVYIDWTGMSPFGEQYWEVNCDNSSLTVNQFPASGRIVSGFIESESDIDKYKISLSSTHDIIIKLTARQMSGSGNEKKWEWASQENGYYPAAVFYNGTDITENALKAYTCTAVSYVKHTGEGEDNFSWNYFQFHPSDNNDWLDFPDGDDVAPRAKFFGNDINTFNPEVQKRLKNWGSWLANKINVDGFRLDFVRGFQENFISGWIKNLPQKNNRQPFIVGEYWGSAKKISAWVNELASAGAFAHAFDFPLQVTLSQMCNRDGIDFNMSLLNHAGLIRNDSGSSLPDTSVVTFVDNHDTGKEHDKWVARDYKMAYAYILTHEGTPCVFYPHYFGVVQHDAGNGLLTVSAPKDLQDDIKKLIYIRKNYLGRRISVLSEIGNPSSLEGTRNVYIARRQGNGDKSGAIIAINNHNSETKGLSVDSSPAGSENWAGKTLINVFNMSEKTTVQPDGRVYIQAPPRGFSVWIPADEYFQPIVR